MPYDDLLDGFEIVPAVDMPALTLDNLYRLYVNSSARRLLGVKPYDMLSLAYRHDTHEIAIIKASDRFDERMSAEIMTSVFPLDKRHTFTSKYSPAFSGLNKKVRRKKT